VSALRILVLVTAACCLTGCAEDVVMLDPRTGETMTCRKSPLNPWSQQEACIGDHVARGWKRLE
jgi:hypothetical protein